MIAGLILAGGAGSRLGGVDKAFVRLGGRRLVEISMQRLAPQTAGIAISANGDAGRFSDYRVSVLGDGALAGKGPLAGVAAGLAWARDIGAEALVTVPVDTPFVPLDLATRLMPANSVAVWQGRQHHLVACWEVGGLPKLLAFLERPGAFKVRDALTMFGARPVAFEDADDPFLNVNTPDDLAAAAMRGG